MVILSLLKIDLEIVHHRIYEKEVENAPERRGPEVVFSGFSGKTVSKTPLFCRVGCQKADFV